MQCPICGNEMEKGSIRTKLSGRSVNFLWAPVEYFENHRFNPDLRSNNSIKKKAGFK